MENKPLKHEYSPSKNNNPFKEYFEMQDNEQKNDDCKASTIIISDKYFENILGKEIEETALETKLTKQLNGKGYIRRRSSHYLTKVEGADMRESLENIGILKPEDEEHLIIRKMKKITEDQYNQMVNRIANNEVLGKLYDYLRTVNCNYKSIYSKSIGCLSTLTYLIETFYKANNEKIKEMNDKYKSLKPYIYKYRTIYGDGNCYYRAIMFRYLEILILNKKVEYFRWVVNDIVESFKSEELNKRRIILNNDVKPDLTFKILFLIIELLRNNRVEEAHQILVKSFSTCPKFDYALILYFRYILYKYIKENENKIYLKSFPIKIGNLLPSQFETEKGEFLFNEFYENYLLKFFTDAEKIIIYLTPFVLGLEIDVIVFDILDDCQKFIWEGDSEIKTDEVISILNNKNHYEIVYTQKDYEKYKSLFEIYENNQNPKFLLDVDKSVNIQKENYDVDDKNKEIQNSKANFNNLNLSTMNIIKKTFNHNQNNNNDNIRYNDKNINNLANNINNINNINNKLYGNSNNINNLDNEINQTNNIYNQNINIKGMNNINNEINSNSNDISNKNRNNQNNYKNYNSDYNNNININNNQNCNNLNIDCNCNIKNNNINRNMNHNYYNSNYYYNNNNNNIKSNINQNYNDYNYNVDNNEVINKNSNNVHNYNLSNNINDNNNQNNNFDNYNNININSKHNYGISNNNNGNSNINQKYSNNNNGNSNINQNYNSNNNINSNNNLNYNNNNNINSNCNNIKYNKNKNYNNNNNDNYNNNYTNNNNNNNSNTNNNINNNLNKQNYGNVNINNYKNNINNNLMSKDMDTPKGNIDNNIEQDPNNINNNYNYNNYRISNNYNKLINEDNGKIYKENDVNVNTFHNNMKKSDEMFYYKNIDNQFDKNDVNYRINDNLNNKIKISPKNGKEKYNMFNPYNETNKHFLQNENNNSGKNKNLINANIQNNIKKNNIMDNYNSNKDKNNHNISDNTNKINNNIFNPKTITIKTTEKNENNLNELRHNNLKGNNYNNNINENNNNFTNNKDIINYNINPKTNEIKNKKIEIIINENGEQNVKSNITNKQNKNIENNDIKIDNIKLNNNRIEKDKINEKINEFNPQKQIKNRKIINKNNYPNLKDDVNIIHNNNNDNFPNNQGLTNKANIMADKEECQSCKKEIHIIKKKYLFCENCLKQYIFNQFINVIKKGYDPMKYFFEEKKSDLIEYYNINYENKIYDNKIKNHLEKKECIFFEDCCGKSHLKLPCNCYLCNHMLAFIRNYNFETRLICQCSKSYNRDDMIKLGVLFSNKNNKICQKIVGYFNHRTKSYCCICGETIINKKHVKSAKFHSSDYKKLNIDENELNNFLEIITHYFCETCSSKSIYQEFTCRICSIKHLLFKDNYKQ